MDLRELWSSGGEKHPSKKGPDCQQNNHGTCQIWSWRQQPGFNSPLSILWIFPALGETEDMQRREMGEKMSKESKKCHGAVI